MPDVVVNEKLPVDRSYSRPYAITLSNTVADRNLQRNGIPYRYVQNIGTGGKVMIAWGPSDTLVDVYVATGAALELGVQARHAKILGTDVGVDLRGFM